MIAVTKHTPGPWKSDIDIRGMTLNFSSIHGPADTAPYHEAIAMIGHDELEEGDFEVIKANVALMEAAPDLLAACKYAQVYIEMLDGAPNSEERIANPPRERVAFRNVIAKAIAKAEGRVEEEAET